MAYKLASGLPSPFRLMLACCRWSYSGEGDALVRALAAEVDADSLITVARRHRVQGLVHDALARLDQPLAEGLAADAQAIAETNLRTALELQSLTTAFAAAGIGMRIIKGLPLAAHVYPRPFTKSAVDIDLLVAAADLDRAAALLGSADYRCLVPARMALTRWHSVQKESVWRRASDGMLVELHHALVDQAGLIPDIGLSSPTVTASVLAGIDLLTFADADQFAYLSLHGGNALWFRAKWLSDVAALLHRAGEIEPLYRAACARSAGHGPALALSLCAKLMGTPLPSSLAAEIDSAPVRRLEAASLAMMLDPREPTAHRWGTLPLHRAGLTMIDGNPAKAREMVRQLRTALYNRIG